MPVEIETNGTVTTVYCRTERWGLIHNFTLRDVSISDFVDLTKALVAWCLFPSYDPTRKIKAIKIIRHMYSLPLRDAKELIECELEDQVNKSKRTTT